MINRKLNTSVQKKKTKTKIIQMTKILPIIFFHKLPFF